MYLLSPVSLCFLCVTSLKKNQVIFFPQDTVQFSALDTTVRNSASFKSSLKEIFLNTFTSIIPLICLSLQQSA